MLLPKSTVLPIYPNVDEKVLAPQRLCVQAESINIFDTQLEDIAARNFPMPEWVPKIPYATDGRPGSGRSLALM